MLKGKRKLYCGENIFNNAFKSNRGKPGFMLTDWDNNWNMLFAVY